MGIDRDEVRRIARLARLRIDDTEVARLAGDLERIVEYIDSLAEVELPVDAESLTYFAQDILRADEAAPGLSHGDALRNAPETDGTFFIVPQIVDKEDA